MVYSVGRKSFRGRRPTGPESTEELRRLGKEGCAQRSPEKLSALVDRRLHYFVYVGTLCTVWGPYDTVHMCVHVQYLQICNKDPRSRASAAEDTGVPRKFAHCPKPRTRFSSGTNTGNFMPE